MKVVFDTNILVSALVFPGGRADIALRRIIEEKDQLLLSKPILDELLGILARKFSRDAEELAHVAVFLSDLSVVVKPRRKFAVLADEPDNRILECAVTGGADAIVTGDKALLALKHFRKVKLLSLRAYLEEVL
jgi:putative PIN family toxin of toxin-antitoxin system